MKRPQHCVVFSALWIAAAAAPSASQPGGQGGPNGKSIYDARCAPCHGVSGKGDGPAAAFLNPRPRDFTAGKFKLRSTETGSIPTDEDLTRSISVGIHGSSMPAWKPYLADAELQAVVEYVKSFSPRFAHEQPKPVTLGKKIPNSPASIAAGQKVYDSLLCSGCHGTDGRGTDAVVTDLKDDWGHDLPAADLTEPWTFRGGSAARDIYLRAETGMDGTPMPAFDIGNDQDTWNLANYIVSLQRKPAWAMTASELAAFYEAREKGAKSNPVKRGRYLVDTLGCAHCHSPIREDGSVVEGLKLAGGQRWRLNPYGDFVASNLTSDKATGLGSWTDEQLKTLLMRGTRPDGSRMLPFPMLWPSYANLKPDDLNAIVAYLRTMPPITNKVPPPRKPNLAAYLWGKFRMLILKEDPPMYVYPGNAGTPTSSSQR